MTQISRSPLVLRGDANGTYGLDPDAPQRLTEHLRELRSRRAAIVHGKHDQGRWDLESLTAQLHELTLEASRTERQLAEAMNTIHGLGACDYFADVEASRSEESDVSSLEALRLRARRQTTQRASASSSR